MFYHETISWYDNTWTSPNHRAFVAWTVHLEYEGVMLAFLLDIIEVPEVRQYLSHITLPILTGPSLIQGLLWRKPFKQCLSGLDFAIRCVVHQEKYINI